MKYCSAPSKRCAVEQFLGAEDAERVEELGADLVLTAVAARRRHERHARADVARVERQRRVVLVVGMRGHVDDRADGRELPQGERQGGRAGQVGQRLDAILGNGLLGTDLPLQAAAPRPPQPEIATFSSNLHGKDLDT